MLSNDEKKKIADQLDIVADEISRNPLGSKQLWRHIRPLISNTAENRETDIVKWLNSKTKNSKSEEWHDCLGEVLMLLVQMNPALPNQKLSFKEWTENQIAAKIKRTSELVREQCQDKNELQIGLDCWNRGGSWREVNQLLKRPEEHTNATRMEISRFSKENNLPIRKGKSGKKPSA